MKLNKKFSIFNFQFLKNESGFSMLLALVAVLVLFTTFSLIKLSSLDSIQPDLRRIGINIGSSPQPLANNQTTSPNQIETDSTSSLSIASDDLEIDGSIESEGDNPPYIE